jgi:hypothetical protein
VDLETRLLAKLLGRLETTLVGCTIFFQHWFVGVVKQEQARLCHAAALCLVHCTKLCTPLSLGYLVCACAPFLSHY